ncbi:MAG TPA: hypothetical protein VF851_08740, partial [Steroidobacteraceae bacterium]
KSMALGVERRGDVSNIRPVEDRPLGEDPYSDNIVDICPVGALQSRQFLYKTRVWFLEPTRSVCPRCSRGCNIEVWHRKQEWQVKALDPRQNDSIARITPHENPEVNGPWICNVGRDLAQVFERTRAEEPMLKGRPVNLAAALDEARRIISSSRHPVALLSNWGSNEELEAFKKYLGEVFHSFVKEDWRAEPGERIEDDLLIRADKNANTTKARELFGADAAHFPEGTDVVLVWGEGFDFAQIPPRAKIIFLNSYLQPENGHADVFFPISTQMERHGHYTNFEGKVSPFEPSFAKKDTVVDAEALFKALAAPMRGHL